METNDIEKRSDKTSSKSVFTKRLRWILVLVILVAAAGTLLFLWWTSRAPQERKELGIFTVRRGDLPITVTEAGDIKALNSTDVKSEVEGRTTIISIVDEGTIITPADVNNGKVLVELDSSDIKEKLTQQEIRFSNEEASYTEAKEALDIQIKQNESDIKGSELKVRFALMDLQKYLGAVVAEKLVPKDANSAAEDNKIASLIDDPNLGGGALQKLRELDDNITLAESKFEQASDTLMWTQKLYDKKFVAETELKKDQLEMQSSRIQMDKSRTALELFRLYEFPKEAEKLLSDYNEAKRELERIEAKARSSLAQAQAKLDSRKATYALEKERLEKCRKQLAACTIKAPVPGQVVYSSSMMGSWQRRNNPIEVGAEIRERQKIISIPDTSEMKVEIKIHETWVDKVQPGQQAKITVAAFPDKTFTGKVLKKAPLADPEEWLNPDLKVYSTDVSIEGTHEFLKTGMSAKVEIIIDELKNVISVPLQTVVNRNGKKVCFVLSSKEPEQREVETGLFNDNFVEIKSGLSEGEEVLLNPPRISEPAAAGEKEKKPEKPI
ncbi:MAG: efflux RND transporter periplasmic adaptor subunit [Sedimentisphaerales bacterium]|nr:efflux RND transporter periplasmic adaptor subunit [Sedimentisphaerales bacterium]